MPPVRLPPGKMTYDFLDYAEITVNAGLETLTTATMPSLALGAVVNGYIIGSRQIVRDTTLATKYGSTSGFEAYEELFYTGQSAMWVYFYNLGDNILQGPEYIPAGDYIRFHQRCSKIFCYYVTSAGTLHAWFEG